MEALMETKSGFDMCDSSAARAVARRRVGALPMCIALGCCDIGEARLEDGRQVLTTWGRNIPPSSQHWFAHNTTMQPVWVGADNGECELILGDTFGSSIKSEWLWAGLRIVAEDGVEWHPVEGE
jgi:hypothetical protein